MFTKTKFRLVNREIIRPNVSGWSSQKTLTVSRIQALRDIPAIGIKKGDLGGYVTSADNLSQEGSCWIGYGASVLGKVQIRDDAYIADKAVVLCDYELSAIVVQDSVRVFNNAQVIISSSPDSNGRTKVFSRISGETAIFGNAQVYNLVESSGDVKIFGEAFINGVTKLAGTIEISGRAALHKDVSVTGKSKITDDAVIKTGASLVDCTVKGKAQIGAKQKVAGGEFHEEGIFMNPTKKLPEIIIGQEGLSHKSSVSLENTEIKPRLVKVLELFESIKKDIASYETDIVKIIKYPVMTDRTDTNTLKMVKLLKKAERLSESPADPEFEDTVSDLEDAFLGAESNALKLAATMLSEADKKKTEKAKDLLAIAADESSSENEKKVSFKQAFKNLEGVITVPEIAVDTFRMKIGLKELEM